MNQHALRPQLVIYKEVQIFTDIDILSAGLSYAGFDAKRQGRVNLTRNMKRYKQFFGVDPSTAAPLFRDLRDNFTSNSLVLIRPLQPRYSEILGTTFHLSGTRMD
jgi:hypothetical protein